MEMQDSQRGDLATSTVSESEFFDLGALFDGHIAREFADFDVDATMKTMVPEPYVHCVPIIEYSTLLGSLYQSGTVRQPGSVIVFTNYRQVLPNNPCE